jgi:integrin beta 3
MQHEQQLEDLAYGLGRRFAEERDRLSELSSAFRVEIDAHKAAALLEVTQALAAVKDGEPGMPGEKGMPGERGEKGDKGDPGEPAPDPTEDIVAAALEKVREDRLELDEKLFAATRRFERLSTELEERLANIKDGEPGPQGEPGPAGRDFTGEARGKYDNSETYLKFDRVAYNGSEWLARKDDPGPLPGEGWMLGVQGKAGRPGAPGVGIQRATTKDYALVLEMTDGKTMTIDLRGMFARYDEERQ